jgi:hypothetical protein
MKQLNRICAAEGLQIITGSCLVEIDIFTIKYAA